MNRVAPVVRYVAVVIAAGSAAAAWLVSRHDLTTPVSAAALTLFVVFTFVGEFRPLRAPLGHEGLELTTSTTFAFAILLTLGTGAAALALAASAAASDLVVRKQWWKVLFNCSQYVLCMTAAGLTFDWLNGDHQGEGHMPLTSNTTLLAAACAAVVLFVTNVALTGTALALAQRIPLRVAFREDFAYQTIANLALLALAPVAVAVGDANTVLLPLLLMPLVVAYKSAAVFMQKEHQAHHDSLTGLPNRVLFWQAASRAIQAAGDRSLAAVIVIDLDRFKEVNDTLGHQVGDRLLRSLGPRLQASIRPTDSIARLGGDEFGVVLADIDCEDTALAVVRRLIETISEPVEFDGLVLNVGASIGVAFYPSHGGDVDTLMQRADVAMYVAKEGQHGWTAYDPSLDSNSPTRLAIVGELRHAIDTGQLVVHYQPKVSVRTGQPTGAEALVRWEHPTRGVVPPNDFVAIAEQTGLIRDLTWFVLREALLECRRWSDFGYDLSVSVNLSARALHDLDLPRLVAGELGRSGIRPDRLVLEITETMIMVDPHRSQKALHQLRALGVQLSVDDYGTGHSSLAYLKHLPITEMKIDQSFVLGLAEDREDAVITRSAVELGRRLGLRVVAEGVESAAALALLDDMDCDEAQGYYFSRPLPATSFLDWIAANTERRGDLAVASAQPGV